MSKTIIWKYEKVISREKSMSWLLTGLFSLCNCSMCSPGSDLNKTYGSSSYKIGSSNMYLQIRFSHNFSEDSFYYSYYHGCPKMDGSIIMGGFEEVFNLLDDVDKDIAIFNLDVLK
jgi:hypothetical protein